MFYHFVINAKENLSFVHYVCFEYFNLAIPISVPSTENMSESIKYFNDVNNYTIVKTGFKLKSNVYRIFRYGSRDNNVGLTCEIVS